MLVTFISSSPSDKFSDSAGDIVSGFETAGDEIGDEPPFGVFETIDDSITSDPREDNTDFGDPFSCSEVEKNGDADLSSFSDLLIPFPDNE